MNFGLARTARLSNLVSQTYHQQASFQPPWKVVHIAGTNGKGSVAAYLAALLRRVGLSASSQNENPNKVLDASDRGLRVGRYTSPHFIDRWDCIVINDRPVAEDVFRRAEAEVTVLARQVEQEILDGKTQSQANDHDTTQQVSPGNNGTSKRLARDARPTQFEILTATAFKIFSDPTPAPCDIAVIECGLGGQEDATNILPASAKAVTIITAIALDHVDVLGGSLRSIVRAKCGILRESVPVVVDGENSEEVLAMIQEEVQERFGAKWASTMVHYARGSDLKSIIDKIKQGISTASIQTSTESHYSRLQSLMPHQLSNLAIAIKAFGLLKSSNTIPELSSTDHNSTDTSLHPNLLEEVLIDASGSYPARLQLLAPGWLNNPSTTDTSARKSLNLPNLNTHSLLLDGAHNVQSALVLKDYIDRATQNNSVPTIYILGLSSTKPPIEILQTLFPVNQPEGKGTDNVKVIFTGFSTPGNMPWVKCTPSNTLLSAAEEVGLKRNVLGVTGDVVEALQMVEVVLQEEVQHEGQQDQKPLIVVAGSLYLASDFLRVLRDGVGGDVKG